MPFNTITVKNIEFEDTGLVPMDVGTTHMQFLTGLRTSSPKTQTSPHLLIITE
jgi:hypothetical protein